MLSYSAISIIGMLVLVVFVLLNLSVQQLVDFEAMGFEVENTEDARVKAGSLRLRSNDLAELGVFELRWKWCPNILLLNWCADLDSEVLHAEGDLGYKLSGAVSLSGMRVEMDSLSLFGVVPGLVDAKLSGQIRSMQITDFLCPLRNSEKLVAQIELGSPQILGNQLESIDVAIEQSDSDYLIELSGDQVQGSFRVDSNLTYLGSGEMTPPPNMAGLMDSMAIPLGGGRYGWELAGEIPC